MCQPARFDERDTMFSIQWLGAATLPAVLLIGCGGNTADTPRMPAAPAADASSGKPAPSNNAGSGAEREPRLFSAHVMIVASCEGQKVRITYLPKRVSSETRQAVKVSVDRLGSSCSVLYKAPGDVVTFTRSHGGRYVDTSSWEGDYSNPRPSGILLHEGERAAILMNDPDSSKPGLSIAWSKTGDFWKDGWQMPLAVRNELERPAS